MGDTELVASRSGATSLARPKSSTFTGPGPRDHHVPRLHVTVDDPGLVGGGEAAGDLEREAQRLPHLQAAPLHSLAQGLSLDELHGDPGAPRRVLADVVDRDDVGAVQGRGRLRLQQEAPRALGVVHRLRAQQLDRHRPPEARVAGAVDDAHPALAEPGGDLVGAESGSDHGSCSSSRSQLRINVYGVGRASGTGSTKRKRSPSGVTSKRVAGDAQRGDREEPRRHAEARCRSREVHGQRGRMGRVEGQVDDLSPPSRPPAVRGRVLGELPPAAGVGEAGQEGARALALVGVEDDPAAVGRELPDVAVAARVGEALGRALAGGRKGPESGGQRPPRQRAEQDPAPVRRPVERKEDLAARLRAEASLGRRAVGRLDPESDPLVADAREEHLGAVGRPDRAVVVGLAEGQAGRALAGQVEDLEMGARGRRVEHRDQDLGGVRRELDAVVDRGAAEPFPTAAGPVQPDQLVGVLAGAVLKGEDPGGGREDAEAVPAVEADVANEDRHRTRERPPVGIEALGAEVAVAHEEQPAGGVDRVASRATRSRTRFPGSSSEPTKTPSEARIQAE